MGIKVGIFYITNDFNNAGPDHLAVPVGDRTVYIRTEQFVVDQKMDSKENPLLVALDAASPLPGESVMNTHYLDSNDEPGPVSVEVDPK